MIKLHISWLSFKLERLGATSRQIDQVAHNYIVGHIAHFYFLVYLWTSPSRIPFVAALGNTSNGRVDAGEVVLGHPEHRTISDTKPRKALHVRQSSLTNTRQGPFVISEWYPCHVPSNLASLLRTIANDLNVGNGLKNLSAASCPSSPLRTQLLIGKSMPPQQSA